MKPHHISTLIDQLIATGKLPSEKPARKARKPVRKRKPVQLKLKLN
jgi:hypothetical protein